jgi:DNA polymerase/3'-5' exonuclease PolX
MKNYKYRILEIFETILKYHQINNENPYIIKNYVNIIHQIQKIKEPITKNTNLDNIKGIGKGFKEKIEIIINTNTLDFYEKILKDKNYNNYVQLYNLSGVGPKKLQEFKKKNIKSISDLKKSIKNDTIKVSSMTKLHLKYYKDLEKKINRKVIEESVEYLSKVLDISLKNIIIAGSYLLNKEKSKDIDLIIINDNIDNIIKKLDNNGLLMGILMYGKDKANLLIKIKNNHVIHIDIRITEKKYLPYYLLYFGSGVNFSRYIRQKAKEKGYKLDQYGLYKNGKNIKFYPKSEKEIFEFLNVDYIEHKNR